MIDLKVIEDRVNKLLENETKESLTKWIMKKRNIAIEDVKKGGTGA